jgi:hypothetical protein
MRCVLSVGLKAGGILVLALLLATQVFAAVHTHHPSLGTPVVRLGVLQFYSPWQGVQWARWWFWSNPALFLWAGIAFGATLVLLVSVWIAAALGRFQPEQQAEEATLATGAQVRKANLVRKTGIVVGKRI